MSVSGRAGTGLSRDDQDPLQVVGRSWGWVLFFGIVTLVLGLLIVIHPRNTVYAFAIVAGIWLFVAGLFRLVTAIADDEDSGGTRWLLALLGILSVIIGLLFLRRTDETVATLAFLIGLFWIVGGIIEFVTAYRDREALGRGLRLTTGVLAFAAGVVTVVWPSVTLTVLVWVIGIWLILYALLMIVLSLQLRRLAY